MLTFDARGKPENPEKNLSEKTKEPTTNFTHSWPELGPRRWEARAITTTPSLVPIPCIEIVPPGIKLERTSAGGLVCFSDIL